MRTKSFFLVCLVSATLSFAGCDSQRLQQFSTLATAGSAYAATFPVFADELGSAQIAIDSATEVRHRPESQDPAKARQLVAQADTDMKAYLATLERLKAHAALLGAYFDTMAQLSSGKNSDQIAASADGLLTSLGALNASVKNASLFGQPISTFVDAGVPLVVAHFQVKALNANLEKNAAVIDEALSLQQAAVKAMQTQFTQAVTSSYKLRESQEVLDPYAAPGELPKWWVSNREAYLRSAVSTESADAAVAAITGLRQAFRDAVENKPQALSLRDLLDLIGKMAGYASSAKAASTAAPSTN